MEWTLAASGHGAHPEYCKHEIFASHSGAQKGFVYDLVKSLDSLSYSVFFDQKHHSLPPGQDFPHHIFSAANTCYVAIVVLSEDFVTSPWPMVELCAFSNRLKAPSSSSVMPLDKQMSLVPLFYKLSPQQIKDEDKVKEWSKVWREWEQKDKRMSAVKCEEAVTKLLPRLNGLVRQSEQQQGEKAYIDTVVDAIFDILHPSHLYGAVDLNMYVGAQRLCQDILGKFPESEQLDPPSSSSDSNSQVAMGMVNAHVSILGMYGLPGSGKSTISHLLGACPSVYREFRQNVLILELPTIFSCTAGANDSPLTQQQLLAKLLSKFDPHMGHKYFADMNVKELHGLFRSPRRICSHKMFLVVDNICACNYGSYKEMVLTILCSRILGSGSKVMLVSRSRDVLENLKKELDFRSRSPPHDEYGITEVPCLAKEEAIELMRQQYSLDRTTSVAKEELISDLLCKSTFQSPFMYIPMVFKLIGVFLRENDDANVLDLCKLVAKGKKTVVQELIGKIFDHLREDLRVLFMDIALFIIPAGYSALINDAVCILCKMHDINQDVFLDRVKELRKHCPLSLPYGNMSGARVPAEIQIHDLFMEYAMGIHGNTRLYVNMIIAQSSAVFSVRE